MAGSMDDEDDLDKESIAFNANKHEQNKRQLSQLKKHNIAAVFGSGTGRLALIAVVLSFMLLGAVGFYNLFKRKAPPPEAAQNANSAVLNAPSGRGDLAVANETEAQLRKEAANQQAAVAASEGKPYLAPPVLHAGQDNDGRAGTTAAPTGIAAADPAKSNPQSERERLMNQGGANSTTSVEAAQAAANAAALAGARANWEKRRKEEVEPQMLAVLGRTEQGQAKTAFSSSYYSLPDRTPKAAPAASVGQQGPQLAQAGGAVAAGKGTPANAQQGPLLVQAGDGYYCETDNKIDTDAARRDVFVLCQHGKLLGAKLIGTYEASKESAVDGNVSIYLTKMSLPGKPEMPIQAVAFDAETGDAGMSDDVDNHTVRKYGGLAVASFLRGIGKAASIVTGTTTTVSNGPISTTQVVQEPMTAARQAKIAAGEVGMSFGDSLARSSAEIKRTVRLGNKKGVRVVFLADVYEEKK